MSAGRVWGAACTGSCGYGYQEAELCPPEGWTELL